MAGSRFCDHCGVSIYEAPPQQPPARQAPPPPPQPLKTPASRPKLGQRIFFAIVVILVMGGLYVVVNNGQLISSSSDRISLPLSDNNDQQVSVSESGADVSTSSDSQGQDESSSQSPKSYIPVLSVTPPLSDAGDNLEILLSGFPPNVNVVL